MGVPTNDSSATVSDHVGNVEGIVASIEAYVVPELMGGASTGVGNVLDILVQNRRDKAAARRFFRRLLKKTRVVPRVIVTDKLRSYGAAHQEFMPSVEHRSHKGLNNRAENSHQPTRQRERAMKGFRSVGAAQRFLSAFSGISSHFLTRRHLMTAPDHRLETTIRFTIWDQITGTTGRPAWA
ncbi:UNVERIFIED_CONTAM: hypothetical protein RKD43_006233 [Streptomyces graminofaciens]